MAAYDWLDFNPLGVTLPGALAERGYEVWMSNNRGTKYSNRNKNDDTWTKKEHWNYDSADMGQYDIPAFVNKMLEVSGAPKVTLMGYSNGAVQIFYALAKQQDFYASRVNRFVAMSSCHYPETLNNSYDIQIRQYLKFDQIGVYNIWGGDETSLTADNCDQISDAFCSFAGISGQEGKTISIAALRWHT